MEGNEARCKRSSIHAPNLTGGRRAAFESVCFGRLGLVRQTMIRQGLSLYATLERQLIHTVGATKQSNEVTRNRVTGKNFKGSKISKSSKNA